MTLLNVPIVGIIIGEGGQRRSPRHRHCRPSARSAACLLFGDPPEGCAAILWRDRKYSEEAANALKLGAKELLSQGIADEVIEEPLGGAHRDPAAAAESIRVAISKHLGELEKLSKRRLLDQRYAKYRSMGEFTEAVPEARSHDQGRELVSIHRLSPNGFTTSAPFHGGH
jgi:acetyl-CoA carboxylase carboxyl transferase subunit alpha